MTSSTVFNLPSRSAVTPAVTLALVGFLEFAFAASAGVVHAQPVKGRTPGSWGVGIFVSSPQGDLAACCALGLGTIMGGEVKILPDWGVRADASFMSHKQRDNTNSGLPSGSVLMLGAAASIVYHVPTTSSVWHPYLLGGVGYFQTTFSQTSDLSISGCFFCSYGAVPGVSGGMTTTSSAAAPGYNISMGSDLVTGTMTLYGELRYQASAPTFISAAGTTGATAAALAITFGVRF